MVGVLYAAIAAVFLLGVAFAFVAHRRSVGDHAGSVGPVAAPDPATVEVAAAPQVPTVADAGVEHQRAAAQARSEADRQRAAHTEREQRLDQTEVRLDAR